ncbi:DUF4188 domain-containing protein [Kibdelosporangium philippinense]|uniref:DUF4188 domain-containing protein n=1 Tax=Kibdelosporangium philippinense TaxID=211113 RepID=A0ABS8ZL61_9PSEU|nr:DUF4188 domain-containing protein [Kibdelosporangium philippinense]MCE7008214.1 DUF4188 domain-containing protein [Kibdelosporangium philippinense]
MTLSRKTHRHDGELVVFLIGMTVNKPWRPDKWLPTLIAMPPMLRELQKDPELGLLGYQMTIGSRGPTLIQYWSSLEKLYAYATKTDAEHRPAWAKFNRRAAKASRAVGVWHETFVVDKHESVYVEAPKMGLAKATELVDVTRNSARNRITSAAKV